MLILVGLALSSSAALVQTVRIEFEFFPGPDGALGTGDDVVITAPTTFSAQPTQLTDQFQSLGIRFTPDPGVNDANEVLNASSFTTPATHTPPNLLASNSLAAIRASFTAPVSRVSALIGISGGSDELEIFDAGGASLGTIVGDDQVVALTAVVPIASFEIRPFGTSTTPAVDNLEFDLSGPSGPVTFCTAGTTTNGCVPSIQGTGTPSATAPSGFTITVNAIEGLKQGLIFYGINNSGYAPLPWGPSSSFLCVKQPTQRTGAQSSGGNLNACDGALTLDWNAFRAAQAGALGQPFASGQHVFVQGWFRDPPSPKSTMLSDGLDFVVGP